VHIGTEKTGTTSIQTYLFNNKKKLRAAGFHFLQCAGSTNNRALPAYFVADTQFDDFYRDEGITTPEEKAEFRQQFLKKFEHEIGTLPKHVHTVIISSEHFHSRIRSTEELDRVHEFLASYFDEFKIICYLRDQSSTCASYYSTGLKAGNPLTFAEFFRRCNPDNYYFNYFQVLSNWERKFGFESMDVSLFSRKTFLNQNLLDDFTAKLDPGLIKVLDKEIDVENESLNPVGQALARGLNLAFPNRTARRELIKVRERCKAGIYQKFRGPGRQPSLALQQRIYLEFEESNEQLRAKYFPHLSRIFDPPAEEPPPANGVDERIMEGLVSLFHDVKKHGKDIIAPDEYPIITRDILSGVLDAFSSEELPAEKPVPKPKEAPVKPAEASPAKSPEKSPPRNKHRKKGIETVISRADLRLLMLTANTIESKNLELAGNLLKLIQEIDPLGPAVKAKLEAFKKRVALSGRNRYAIAYTGMVEAADTEARREQGEQFHAWLMSFADCIDGSAINVLKDTNAIRLESSNIIRNPSISGGFTIVCVDSEEAAHSIAERCPLLAYGGTVFVSEVQHVTP